MRIKTDIKFGELVDITDGPKIKVVEYYPESGKMEEWVLDKMEVNPDNYKRLQKLYLKPVYYTRSFNDYFGKNARTEIMVQGYEGN